MLASRYGARRLATCAALIALHLKLACAAPWPITFSNNATAGPDGPWNVIEFSIDSPDQGQTLIPSLREVSVIVNQSICSSSSAHCENPLPGMWKGSTFQTARVKEDSDEFSPANIADQAGFWATELMEMSGQMRYVAQRFSLQNLASGASSILDPVVAAVADNVEVTFAGGAAYTLSTGFLSLFGAHDTFTYAASNGSSNTLNLSLPLASSNAAIPSLSYGLHIGSATHQVGGSLYLGGYDQSRVIKTPLTASSTSTFNLAGISLGVSKGGNAFLNIKSDVDLGGLLTTNSSSVTIPLSVAADPGVPYLYLPSKTCDTIASKLPVSYDTDFELYIWDTTSPAYEEITASPHYLSFSFYISGTSGGTSSIEIPFTLLNLTLDAPLTTAPKTYFPCRPYDNTNSTNPNGILGRAFLQGAFLGHNWASETMFLAQAPGPGHEDASATTMASTDTTIAPLTTSGLWNDTWSDVLRPLTSSGKLSTPPAGLSAGAKTGIVIGAALGGLGVIAGVAGSMWCRKRRRQKKLMRGQIDARQVHPTELVGVGDIQQLSVAGSAGSGGASAVVPSEPLPTTRRSEPDRELSGSTVHETDEAKKHGGFM